MQTILFIALVLIAAVLILARWKIVRAALLWINAIVCVLAMIGALIVFGFALFNLDSSTAIVGLALLVVAGISGGIEKADRNSRFDKWRAQFRQRGE